MRKAMDGPIGDQISESVRAARPGGLAFYDSGARSFYNSKRPINSPADMKGMKFRVIQSDIFVDMVECARRQRDADALWRSLFGARDRRHRRRREQLAELRIRPAFRGREVLLVDRAHASSPEVLVMSKKSFDKLTPEDQGAVVRPRKESVVRCASSGMRAKKKSEKKIRAERRPDQHGREAALHRRDEAGLRQICQRPRS